MLRFLVIFWLFCGFLSSALAARPDAHAPIGVMRDHLHQKGEFMASYRYSQMKMDGLRNNSGSVSNSEALTRRGVIPLSMRMKMDMIGLMYGLTDDVTLSAMGTVISKEMDHRRSNGSEFERKSDGIGDSKINASYGLVNNGNDSLLLNLGLSLPTGSIDQHFLGARLPYPMQIGSGSYELLPGVSYTALRNGYSYGGQVNASFKFDTNDNGYKLGDSYNATAWIARNLTRSLSISTRLDYNKYEAIEGRDTTLNATALVTADNAALDRETIDGLVGVNYIVPSSILQDFRLAFEFGSQFYQRSRDDLLETEYKFILGLQKTF